MNPRESLGARHKRGTWATLATVSVIGALLLAACGTSSTATSGSTDESTVASVAPTDSVSEPAAEATAEAPSDLPEGVGTVDQVQSIADFCGDKAIKVGYVDSWAGVNAWRKITKAELVDEASKCPNVELLFTDGQGSLQKTISDIQGLVAQDVDAMVVMMADFGEALLPAIQEASAAGVKVSALIAPGLGGTPGVDYVANVYADEVYDAKVRTAWLARAMGGEGNIIHLGGTPGNPLSAAVNQGIQEQLQIDTGVKLLQSDPVDTNFDPAVEQKAVAGLLTKYDDLDGIQNECGTCAPGGVRAFVAAARPLVPWTSDDNNELACMYYDLKDANPGFEIMTTAARNWLSRVALHFAVASAQGIAIDEPQVFTMPIVEDSLDPNLQPKCVEGAPAGAIFSSMLTDDQVVQTVQ